MRLDQWLVHLDGHVRLSALARPEFGVLEEKSPTMPSGIASGTRARVSTEIDAVRCEAEEASSEDVNSKKQNLLCY